MRTKDMQAYRHSVLMSTSGLNYEMFDSNFIGHEHENTSGFFKIMHGMKSDIAGLLAMPTEMAEDGQAVYEFIQNAADSNSTHFYMFYNENYLLTINNGSIFDKGGITSILNIGQSYDKKHDPDKIGRFGIGFKLVHRLIGATSGLNEIMKEYKGPQLFSWSKKSDFDNFIEAKDFNQDGIDNGNPWLMKILYTCFPTTVNETIKDKDYKDQIAYTTDEINDFQNFLKEHLHLIDTESLEQGTMIFLKLGQGKNDLLKKDQDDINSRLENTLYFLNDLQHIQVNNKLIERHSDFILENSFVIDPNEREFQTIGLTDERDSKFPVILQFGYNKYNGKNKSEVKDYPNFYKFFPMEDTTYGLQFIFHSNVFSIGSNRRHIHQDSINEALLSLLSKKIADRMQEHISNFNYSDYNNIFANLILSDSNHPFVKNHLFEPLLKHITEYIPTDDGEFLDSDRVIIKNTNIHCIPSNFGIDKKWYKWHNKSEDDQELIKQSKNDDKLGLKTFNLKKLIEEGDVNSTNKWIESLDESEFQSFLNELNSNTPKNLEQIKFIRLEDNNLISIDELTDNIIIKFPKVEPIEKVLNTLKFTLTKTNYEEYEELKNELSNSVSYLKETYEDDLFHKYIKEKLTTNTLEPEEKIILFITLQNFRNIGNRTLANELLLFCNSKNEITTLSKLVSPTINNLENWLNPFTIKTDEYFQELDNADFLRNEQNVYNDIIIPNWEKIVDDIEKDEVINFYQSVEKYYKLTENSASIKSLNYIYCEDKGWIKNSSELFYYDELSDFNHLNGLIEVIHANNLLIPYTPTLKFFGNSESPFQINNSDVTQLYQSVDLTNEGAIALIEFSKGKYNIFEYGTFVNSNNLIKFNTDSELTQYYSSKEQVHNFINLFCSESLSSLPQSLSHYREGTLRGEELYKHLIELSLNHWTVNNENLKILLLLLLDSDLVSIVKEFISNQQAIELSSNSTSIENSITFVWMQLINSIYEIEELEDIRKKFYINGIKLSDLSWNNHIVLGEQEIALGAVHQKYSDNSIIWELKEKVLNTKRFNSQKINALFQSNNLPEDEELLEIAQEMLGEENNQLKNTDQLNLIIYLYQKELIKDIEHINVKSLEGEWYTLKDDWFLRQLPFINENAILNPMYENLKRITETDFSINSKPYFRRDQNKFICSHLKENLNDSELLQFMELVKEQITKNAQSEVDWLDDLVDEIGFNPKQSVFSENRLFVSELEKLPNIIIDWAKRSQDNLKTLSAIGVHTETSPIVKLRKFLFINEDQDYTFDGFSKNNEIDSYLLENTVSLLINSELKFNSKYKDVFKSLTSYLQAEYDISEIGLPIAVGIENNDIVVQFKSIDYAIHYHEEAKNTYKALTNDNFSDFIQQLISLDINITSPYYLSEMWLERYTHPMGFGEPEVDLDKLIADSKECEITHYKQWLETTETDLTIKIIENSIPCTFTVNYIEEWNITTEIGDWYFDEETRTLYTKETKYLDAIIAELKDSIEGEELAMLLGSGSASLPVKSNREEELEAEIIRLKEQLNNLSPRDDIERGDLDGDGQEDWNLKARQLLKEQLDNIPEFDCSDWDDSNIPSSLVRGVKYKGEPCTWIVRSAMSTKAIFHLTPLEWVELGKENVFLALRVGKTEMKIYGFNENENIKDILFETNHTINFNFNPEMISFAFIDAFAKILVMNNIYGSGLVFKNPNYSAGVSLSNLNTLVEGEALTMGDDAL